MNITVWILKCVHLNVEGLTFGEKPRAIFARTNIQKAKGLVSGELLLSEKAKAIIFNALHTCSNLKQLSKDNTKISNVTNKLPNVLAS
jgi:hypothetical protein